MGSPDLGRVAAAFPAMIRGKKGRAGPYHRQFDAYHGSCPLLVKDEFIGLICLKLRACSLC